MEPVTIPKHMDDPVTLLIWSADEFAPAAFMLILGILIGQVAPMTVLCRSSPSRATTASATTALTGFRYTRPIGSVCCRARQRPCPTPHKPTSSTPPSSPLKVISALKARLRWPKRGDCWTGALSRRSAMPPPRNSSAACSASRFPKTGCKSTCSPATVLW